MSLFLGLGIVDIDYDEATETDVMDPLKESDRVEWLYEAGCRPVTKRSLVS